MIASATCLLATLAAHPELFVHTRQVEDLAFDGRSVWAATRGGLERYGPDGDGPIAHYGTADGLDHPHVVEVMADAEGLHVRTRTGTCLGIDGRFTCTSSSSSWEPQWVAAPRYAGSRVTDTLDLDGIRLVATADAGLWIDDDSPTRLTPEGQICTNHATALTEYAGALWIGGFDEGLCVRRDHHFERVDVPFRMVNDLRDHEGALWVAASEGVFRTTDGVTFSAIDEVDRRGANGLATLGDTLWISTPGVTYALGPDGVAKRWMLGGSHSIQRVFADRGTLWFATEDRGAVRQNPALDIAVFDRTAGLPSSWALDVVATPDGTAFVGTLRDGVVRIDPRGAITPVAGLEDRWVLDLYVDGEDVWVGTQGAAFKVRDDAAVRLDGVGHHDVHRFLRTDDGLWVATDAGLLLYRDRQVSTPTRSG